MSELIDVERLKRFKNKQDAANSAKFVAQVPGKGLSTNDFTDELKQKVEQAGESDFSGAYADLTGKPAINGHELAPGANDAGSLGLATSAELAGKADGSHTHTAAQVTDLQAKLDEKAGKSHTHTTAQVSGLDAALAGKQPTGDYATNASVDSKLSTAKTEMQGKIDAAVSSVYEPKGSVAFASLPKPSAAITGDVYNISDAFNTTADWVEGAGKSYPSGTNAVCIKVSDTCKWDALSGMVDLSLYLKRSELVVATDGDIDALF